MGSSTGILVQSCVMRHVLTHLHSPGNSSVLLGLRPLVVVGKGAAFSQADAQLRAFVEAAGAPFLATAMGRGVVPDSHPLSANAARSAALRGADVAIIFGARCVLHVLSAECRSCMSIPQAAADSASGLSGLHPVCSAPCISLHGAKYRNTLVWRTSWRR